jgi:hypothetical protein
VTYSGLASVAGAVVGAGPSAEALTLLRPPSPLAEVLKGQRVGTAGAVLYTTTSTLARANMYYPFHFNMCYLTALITKALRPKLRCQADNDCTFLPTSCAAANPQQSLIPWVFHIKPISLPPSMSWCRCPFSSPWP